MKKLSTSQWLLGAGIVALIYILYKKQQQESQKDEVVEDVEGVVVEETDTNEGETKDGETKKDDGTKTDGGTKKLDTSEVPAQCLDGFTLNGKRYSIQNNQFVKE